MYTSVCHTLVPIGFFMGMTSGHLRPSNEMAGFPLGLKSLQKMGRHFPVREKTVNFKQTGKVGENHTKYWKGQGSSDKCYYF